MFKKITAVLCAALLLIGSGIACVGVSAYEAEVDGVRWFPCEDGRENDELWEVECEKDGCLCQRFTDSADTTGYENFLSTTYGSNGSLTLRRTGADGQDFYWPRVRTLMMETYPELDLDTANTLYFDLTATDCQWNIYLTFAGLTLKLGKPIANACGVGGMANSDADAPAGTYRGSLNLKTMMNDLIAEGTTESAINASALQYMQKHFVPQVQIFYIGDTSGSLKISKLFISSSSDKTGAKCTYADMAMVFGDEYYDLYEDTPTDDYTDEPAEEEDYDYSYDDEYDYSYDDYDYDDSADTITTRAPQDYPDFGSDTPITGDVSNTSSWIIVFGVIVLILAIVFVPLIVIAAVIILIVVLVKKKNRKKAAAAGNPTQPPVNPAPPSDTSGPTM